MMENYILRGIGVDGFARVFQVNIKEMVNYVKKLHGLNSFTTQEFSKILTAGALMSAMLKNDKDLITISLRCDGDIKGIIVTANSKNQLKGYVYEPSAVGDLGQGSVSVVKDLGLKEPIVSLSNLISSDIEKTLNHYFETSEQIKTILKFSNNGGYLVQLMPGASEEVRLKFDKIDLENDVKIYEKRAVEYFCDCSREKALKAIISLGKEELQDIIKTDGHINIHCHFCNSDYKFFEEDTKTM